MLCREGTSARSGMLPRAMRREVGSRPDAELAVDARLVHLDRLGAQEQLASPSA
jgi:hypothetical protein